jgi:hypothetical protein
MGSKLRFLHNVATSCPRLWYLVLPVPIYFRTQGSFFLADVEDSGKMYEEEEPAMQVLQMWLDSLDF